MSSNIKSYWIFRHGQFVSQFGNSCFLTATTLWLTYNQSNAKTVGLITSIPMMASILLGPFVGSIVDLINARKLLITLDLIGALLSSILAFIYWHEKGPTQFLLIGLFLINFSHALFGVFYFTLLEKIYSDFSTSSSERLILRGQTQTMTQLISILSPTFSGFLLKFLGPFYVIIIDSFSYVYGAITAYLGITKKNNLEKSINFSFNENNHFFIQIIKSTFEGIRYIWRNNKLKQIIAVFMGINLFTGGTQILLSYYIKDELKLNLTFIPILLIPSALISLLVSRKMTNLNKLLKKIKIDVFDTGILLIALAFLILLKSSMISVIVFHILFSIVGLIVNLEVMNQIQEIVPNELQGRIFASILVVANIFTPLSIFVTSALIDYKYFRTFGTILTIAIGLCINFVIKKIWDRKFTDSP